MKNIILLSICIPTYNREKYLKECIDSIISQKGFDDNLVEIVIADNASTDNTTSLVHQYQKIYRNIRYFRNNKNIGSIKNIKSIVNYASGKYSWFLADDDCLTNFSLKYILEIIQKSNFDIMFARVKFTENTDIKIDKKHNYFEIFKGIREYLHYLHITFRSYQELISFFSFYSIIIVKNSYLKEAMFSLDKELIESNNFPHDIIVYSDLENRKIIVPDNVFVIGRILNESYGGSLKLIKDFKENIRLITRNNNLEGYKEWENISKLCINGWTKTIILSLLVKKMHLNYKSNYFLKKLYYLYKSYLQ